MHTIAARYILEITNILLATYYGKTPAYVMFCLVFLGSSANSKRTDVKPDHAPLPGDYKPDLRPDATDEAFALPPHGSSASLRLRQRHDGGFLSVREDEQEFADAYDTVHVCAVGFRQVGCGHEDAQPLSVNNLCEVCGHWAVTFSPTAAAGLVCAAASREYGPR